MYMSEADKDQEKLADRTVLKESETQPLAECQLPVSSKSIADTPIPRIDNESKHPTRARSIAASKNFESLGVHDAFAKFVITILLFVLGSAMSVFCVSSTIAWPWQLNWPVAEGQVTKIEIRNKNSARFYYQYRVEEREFKNVEVRADSLEHTVQVGKKVHVRYNPRRNEESIMEGGFNIVETPLYILVAVGLFSASLFYALKRSK